jgi:hypothetical protein
LSGNTAEMEGGGAFASTLYNCTVCGNSVANFFGDSGGVWGSTLYNCIVYSNSATVFANYGGSPMLLNYCCTTPIPTNGIGNTTNNPFFVDFAGGNFHLQPNSPCINAANNGYVRTTNDLDGNPRISGGTVDMGAYEFQNPPSIISYAWLQQYGFLTDGSADFMDPDGDGMNNLQEWICGTDATNAASLLKMLAPRVDASGVAVPWLSVTNRSYFLQRAAVLGPQPAFLTIATNIPGQLGITTFTDTNATRISHLFYRVGIRQ